MTQKPGAQDSIVNLDHETQALYQRIKYIKSLISENATELPENASDLSDSRSMTEYQEFVLEYIGQIKNQIEENHEEYEQLYRLKNILEQNVEKLSDSLNVARKQIERQNIKLSSMSKAKNDFDNKEKEFELTIRDYQSQIRDVKKYTSDVDNRIREITTKNSTLAQEVSELTTENAELQQEKDQLESEYFNLNEKVMGLEQALEAKNDEYQRIYDRIQTLESQINSNEDNADSLIQENLDLGEGIIEMEKTLTYMRDALYKFMNFIRKDLPGKSLYKILFCLVENKRVRVKEFKDLVNITVKQSYVDIKQLEELGLVFVDRHSARSYVDYMVSLAMND